MAFEWFLAWRYLRASKGFASVVAWFSLLGVGIGVATLIVVMSVMNGFRIELWGALVGVRGDLFIQKQPYFSWDDATRAERTLLQGDGVTCAIPILERQAIAMAGGQARGVQIHGLTAQHMNQRPRIKRIAGQIFTDGIWLGCELARAFNAQVGSRITLIQPLGRTTPFGRVPENISTQVQGIFSTGMYEFDKNMILMDIHKAQQFYHTGRRVSHLEVHLKQGTDPKTIIQSHILGPEYEVRDWRHADSALFHAVEVERHVMFVILSLIILIASFNIISSLIMLVQQKTRDIAVLRAMGVSRAAIGRIFLLTGSSIGIVGTTAGVCLGLGFAAHVESIRLWLESLTGANLFQAEIYFLSRLPCHVDLHEVCWIASLSLFVTIIAALYPARRASRMEPVDALRY